MTVDKKRKLWYDCRQEKKALVWL